MTRELPQTNTEKPQRSLGKSAERLIRVAPDITRHELASALGVSLSSVNPIVSRAIDAGRVRERVGARADGSVGRPRSGLVAAGPKSSFVLVLWSHGYLRSSVVSFDGDVQVSREEPITRGMSVPHADDIVRVTQETLELRFSGIDRPRLIVLGVPAPYEYGLESPGRFRGRFAPEASGRWFTTDPADELQHLLKLPVVIENDSNLAALGEGRAGAAVGLPMCIYLRLSDRGIGAGLIVGGRLVEGADGFAGEISHARVDFESATICSCGSRGCLRTKLGPNLIRPLASSYGEDLTYTRMLDLAATGEPGPVRVLTDAGRAIGVPLAPLITFLNPSAVVLEAGSPSASRTVLDGIAEYISQSAPPFILDALRLEVATLGPAAVSTGAIAFAREVAIGEPMIARRFAALPPWHNAAPVEDLAAS